MASPLAASISDSLDDKQLVEAVEKSVGIFEAAIQEGKRHWVVAFSGGKDSSLVATLVVELLRRGSITDVEVDIVYSDTLMELPPFAENALTLLSHIREIGKQENLPLRTHIAVAAVEQRFWFLVIGKGYPPPHNHFRWCTERLKIRPSKQVMKRITDESSMVITGVRYGESDSRDSRLKATLCSKDDSECGQGAWVNGDAQMGLPGLAPIAHWRTCQVWDLLMFADIAWKWPFLSLSHMYGDNPATRFGCWMCTLVREDKALKAVTKHEQWNHLTSLTDIRTMVLEEGRKETNRIRQPNGNLGRTSLDFRQQLLTSVLEMQVKLNTPLITSEEVQAIQSYWEVERETASPYNNECKFWKWLPVS